MHITKHDQRRLEGHYHAGLSILGKEYRTARMSIKACRTIAILLLSFVSVAMGQYAHADTNVGGNITKNTTWAVAGSPYIVTSTVQVLKGVKLTIEAGVEIRFEYKTDLNIGGELNTIGTQGKMITFTNNQSGWMGSIRFTSISPPTVVTSSATLVTSTSATLNGTVNPNGLSTDCYFEYGPTTSYGSTTSSASAGSGTSAVSINAAISGLPTDTTKHYRLVASNSGGTSYGDDKTFSTVILYVESSGSCAGNIPCYLTIQEAVNAATSGATIKIAEGIYDEDLIIDTSNNLTLQGGWDTTFTGQSSTSSINSTTINDGTITVDELTIQ